MEVKKASEIYIGKALDEKPWKPKKVRSLKLADSLKRQKDDKRALRVRYCGSQLAFWTNTETGVKILHTANFCHDRLCPLCAWQKSRKCFDLVSKVMNVAQAKNPKLVPIFLTLTLRNCSGEELSRALDAIFQGWNRLMSNKRMKRIIEGWFRALEVTYNNEKYKFEWVKNRKTGKKEKVYILDDNGNRIPNPSYDTYHPHLHVILMVDRSYFKGEDYMQTTEWVKLWRKSLRLDYDPICDIRKVKGGKKAIKEVSKYTVKDVEYISDDKEMTDRTVSIFSSALRNRRLYAFGGILKEIAKQVEKEIKEKKLETEENLREDILWILILYQWNMGLANYIATEEVT